jgi:recombination protein RecA
MARKKNTAGKISVIKGGRNRGGGSVADRINKRHGKTVAHTLKSNPANVTQWISTGSRWLDSITGVTRIGGIPVGRISEIAGLEGTGKSFIAAQIANNALSMGMIVLYFDSEASISSDFVERMGMTDNENFVIVRPPHLEAMFEDIEAELVGRHPDDQYLFILDSLAMIPCKSDLETDFDPTSTVAVKARVTAKGMSKLVNDLNETNSTLLVLNQLKTNIGHGKNPKYLTMKDKYNTPGGKAMAYAYSLRIWLEGRQAKDSFVYDDKGFRIGSEVKVTLLKSRFGGDGRKCVFKILWAGDSVSIQDEESWFDALKTSPHLKQAGAWYTLVYADGKEKKFQAKQWVKLINDDPAFKARAIELMDEEVIRKFNDREGSAADFYDIE